MTPHSMIDALDEVLNYVQRGENAAATHRLLRLIEQEQRDADELDRWVDAISRDQHYD